MLEVTDLLAGRGPFLDGGANARPDDDVELGADVRSKRHTHNEADIAADARANACSDARSHRHAEYGAI